MPPEIESSSPDVASAVDAPAVTPDTPIPPGGRTPEQAARLLNRHAAKAQAIADKELADKRVEENRVEPVERDATETDPATGKPRAPDGKFRKEAVTKPDGKPLAEKPKAEAAESTVPAAGGSLVAITKLVQEGKVSEALRAIGLDETNLTAKGWQAWRAQNSKERAALDKQANGVRDAYQRVENIARSVEQELQAARAARKAYAEGDIDAAVRWVFGEDFNTISQKEIRKLATRDPEVAKLRAELEARDRREAERQTQWQAQQQKAAEEQQRADYVAGLGREMEALEDPRIAAAIEVEPDFAQRVFNIQAKHYRASTDSTITTEEAAELALSELEGEYVRRSKIFGGGAPAPKPAVGGGKSASREGPTGQVSSVKPRNFSKSREAVEAHAEEKPTGEALRMKYVRQAQEALDQERARQALG